MKRCQSIWFDVNYHDRVFWCDGFSMHSVWHAIMTCPKIVSMNKMCNRFWIGHKHENELERFCLASVWVSLLIGWWMCPNTDVIRHHFAMICPVAIAENGNRSTFDNITHLFFLLSCCRVSFLVLAHSVTLIEHHATWQNRIKYDYISSTSYKSSYGYYHTLESLMSCFVDKWKWLVTSNQTIDPCCELVAEKHVLIKLVGANWVLNLVNNSTFLVWVSLV